MDQPFDSEVMEDLAAESQASSADAAFDEFEGMEEDLDTEDAQSNETDGFEQGDDETFFAEEDVEEGFGENFEEDLGEDFLAETEDANNWNALEDATADALDAEDTDEFFSFNREEPRPVLKGGVGRNRGRGLSV